MQLIRIGRGSGNNAFIRDCRHVLQLNQVLAGLYQIQNMDIRQYKRIGLKTLTWPNLDEWLLESFLLLFENEISLVFIILNRPLVDVLLLEVSLFYPLPEFYAVLKETFREAACGIRVCSNMVHYINLVALTLIHRITVLTLVYLGNR